MARKKHESHENHERWLVSYADFITLLFAFFVVMFASSQTDKARAKQISEAVEQALDKPSKSISVQAQVAKILGGTVDDKGQGNAQRNGPGGAQRATKEAPPEVVVELTASMKTLSAELQQEIKEGKVELIMQPRGLVISLKLATFFPSGEDMLEPASYSIIKKLADIVGPIPNRLLIEGHTDSIPIHNARFRSNWELSIARSMALMDLLVHRFEVDQRRIGIAGYADNSPEAPNDTPENRTRNRRVDIVILNDLARAKPEELGKK